MERGHFPHHHHTPLKKKIVSVSMITLIISPSKPSTLTGSGLPRSHTATHALQKLEKWGVETSIFCALFKAELLILK